MISNRTALGLGLALFAAVASASSASAASSDPDMAGKASAKVAAKASATTKYCVVGNVTGSRLPRKECRTRADWMAREGFDPLTKK